MTKKIIYLLSIIIAYNCLLAESNSFMLITSINNNRLQGNKGSNKNIQVNDHYKIRSSYGDIGITKVIEVHENYSNLEIISLKKGHFIQINDHLILQSKESIEDSCTSIKNGRYYPAGKTAFIPWFAIGSSDKYGIHAAGFGLANLGLFDFSLTWGENYNKPTRGFNVDFLAVPATKYMPMGCYISFSKLQTSGNTYTALGISPFHTLSFPKNDLDISNNLYYLIMLSSEQQVLSAIGYSISFNWHMASNTLLIFEYGISYSEVQTNVSLSSYFSHTFQVAIGIPLWKDK